MALAWTKEITHGPRATHRFLPQHLLQLFANVNSDEKFLESEFSVILS